MKLSPDKKSTFNFKTNAFGVLVAFNLLRSNKNELHSRLRSSIEKSESIAYVRALITVCCYPESSLVEGEYRPSDYLLSLDDAKKLTVEELEVFSTLYLKHNDYLYRETRATPKPKNDGTGTILVIESGAIEHLRTDNESSINYLYRISVLHEKKENAQAEKMLKTLGMTSFSSGLQEQIISTLNMGTALKDTMRNIGRITPYDIRPTVDTLNMIRQQEEARLKPYRELSGKLDELIKLSSSTADFIVEMNETQTTIAAELKASGKTTTFFAKVNIAISILIIFLTAFSLWVGYRTTSSNDNVAQQQLDLTDKYASKIIKSLDDINGHSQLLSKQTETSLEKLVEQQKAFISELKDIRLQEEKRLEFLLKKAKENK